MQAVYRCLWNKKKIIWMLLNEKDYNWFLKFTAHSTMKVISGWNTSHHFTNKFWFTVHIMHQLMFEEDCTKWSGMNLEGWNVSISSMQSCILTGSRTFDNCGFLVVQFTSVPWATGSSGGQDGRFSRDLLPVFSAWGPCEQLWNEQE